MPHEIELPDGSIAEFPDSMSDAEIEKILAKEFPSKGQPKQQPTTILQDVQSDIAAIPGALLKGARDLPGELKKAGKFAYQHPLQALADVPLGAVEGTIGLLDIPQRLSKYLAEKGVPGAKTAAENLPLFDEKALSKALGMGEEQEGEGMFRGAGRFIPGGAIVRGGKALGVLNKAAKEIPITAGIEAAGRGKDPISGAMMGEITARSPEMAADAGTMLGEKMARRSMGMEKPSPIASKMFETPLSNEELKKAMQTAEGTETNLGRVLQNPALSEFYENLLNPVPGAGVKGALMRDRAKVVGQTNDLMEKFLKGQSPKNIEKSLTDALKQAYKDAQTEKRTNFAARNKLADELGVKVGQDQLQARAKEWLQEISQDKDLARKMPKDVMDDLKWHAGVNIPKSLNNANIYRGVLREAGNKHYLDGNHYVSNIYADLKEAANEDMETAIARSDSPELKDLHDKANKYYADNIAPFDEPEITKFIRKGGDPDMILNTFLKIGRTTDRANALEKLMNKLPDNMKGLVPYAYYKRAIKDGKLNPAGVYTLYKNLGNRQREVLHADKNLLKEMDTLAQRINQNPKASDVMFNPKTGYSLASHAGLGGLGMLISGIGGGASGAGMATLSAWLSAKGLRSPAIRKRLINRIIKERTEGTGGVAPDVGEQIADAMDEWFSKKGAKNIKGEK